MNKKLFIALSLIAFQSRAMDPSELTIQQATAPADKKMKLLIEEEEIILLAQYIPLIGTLNDISETFAEESKKTNDKKKSDTEKSEENLPIPLPQVNLKNWNLIEPQLARLYEMDNNGILAECRELEGITLSNFLREKIRKGDGKAINEIFTAYRGLKAADLIELQVVIGYLDISLIGGIINEIMIRKLHSLCMPLSVTNKFFWPDSFTFTADGKLIIGEKDGTLKLYMTGIMGLFDDKTAPLVFKGQTVIGEEGKQFIMQFSDLSAVAVTPENKLVLGSQNGMLWICDKDGHSLAFCVGHKDKIEAICITHDNKIVSGSEDGMLRIWDMNGNELAAWEGHGDLITSVCVTHDNKIVSGSWDNTVKIWDTNGNELAVWEDDHEGVHSLCITHDNKIVSGAVDGTMRIWDTNGNELAVCNGHKGLVRTLCVTPNNLIVSGSEDGRVRIWATDGTQLADWRAHTERVCTVFATADGKIVSGSAEEQTMLIWDMSAFHLFACFSQMSKRQREFIALLLDSTEYLMNQEYLRQTKARLITAECLVEEAANIQKIENSAVTGKKARLRNWLEKLSNRLIKAQETEAAEIVLALSKKRKKVENHDSENGDDNLAKKGRFSDED